MLSKTKLEGLLDILPSSQILSSSPHIIPYRTDASNIIGAPDIVVLPEKKDEISRLLAWAYREKVYIVPRGSGTGVTGGSVPIYGGLVLCLTKMNRILDIDKKNMLAVVEPGVITGELKCSVEHEGLFYPPDPSSSNACTLGGNIAENAGGPKAVKYGVTRDYCLGLEVALCGGKILNTGAKSLKSVVGYDLTRLFVGSEGTLGVITKAFLKLIPKPETAATIKAYFRSLEDAVGAVTAIFQKGLIPSVLELLDYNSIKCVSAYLKIELPADLGAMLIIEFDGANENVRSELACLKELFSHKPHLDIEIAKNEEEREDILRFRRSISPAIYRMGRKKINEDICIPRGKLIECFISLDRIADKYDLIMANFGHAGDGNIHVNIMLPDEGNDCIWKSRERKKDSKLDKAVREIFEMALKLGGTISGEHGIGITKAPYMDLEISPTGIKYMKGIKEIFDPTGLLNPGKIFEK